MAKYLDWGGVLTLWSKIKTLVAGYVKFETESGTGADAITIGNITKVPIQSITAGTGLNTTGNDSTTDGGTIGMGSGLPRSGTIHLTKSGVTAGSYGLSDNATPSAGNTFKVPYITIDKYGRVTAASTNTVTIPINILNTAGSTDTNDKIYLIGAKSLGDNPLTYSDSDVYVQNGNLNASSYNGLSILFGAGSWKLGSAETFLSFSNSYNLNDACSKKVDTSITTSSSSNLPTTDAVKNYVISQLSSVTGALVYKGIVTSESMLLNTALTKGWYYIVNMPNVQTTSINIGGIECESGDMIIVNTAGTYTTPVELGDAVDIILSNISVITDAEINGLS